MNIFEKFLYMLQAEMETPKPFGWFHFLWIFLIIATLIVLFKNKSKYSEKQLKIVLGTYGIVALLLEIGKQLIWSFNYDPIANVVTWDYQWYAAPFQFCTTPIFASMICLFLNNSKLRNSLLSYIAFATILGSIVTILLPDSCFTCDILVNVHTMWLHCGSFVVSIYLLMTGAAKVEKQNLESAIKVFLVFVLLAEVLNVSIYNSGILNGETFNMFYISPYFITHLPVFNTIQENVPFLIYLLIYIFAISVGATLVYYIVLLINKRTDKKKHNKSYNNKKTNPIKEKVSL